MNIYSHPTFRLRDSAHAGAVQRRVREERLRALSALPETAELTSWRGLSGRRYVVGVHPPVEAEIAEADESVVIAVRRRPDGTAAVLEATASSPSPRARLSWLARMREGGATELHVHRLAADETARREVVADLEAGEPAAAWATAC